MPAPPKPERLRKINLHAVQPDARGYTRKKAGKRFQYFDLDGQRITRSEVIERIDKLAIPPAWTDVWICADARGYVQATGRDAKDRKQSIYHADWSAHREESKYSRLDRIQRAVGRARTAVAKHIRRRNLDRTKVLAAVVRLLDLTLIRVGSDRYVIENKSYGLTTLQNRHLSIEGSKITFSFRGKSGVSQEVTVQDRALASLLGKLKELRGARLFQYIDSAGKRRAIKAADVNQYLREIGGSDLTAKDFRTLRATKLAKQLVKERKPRTKKEIAEVVAEVASTLGNTPSIARKSYIDPSVLEVSA